MANTTLTPNANGTSISNFAAVGDTTVWECTDEGIAGADDDTTHGVATLSDGVYAVKLSDTPSDFVSAGAGSTITLKLRHRYTTSKGDAYSVSNVLLRESDETTLLTGFFNPSITTSYVTYTSVVTVSGTDDKATWDGAVFQFEVTGSNGEFRVTAVEVQIDNYEQAAAGSLEFVAPHSQMSRGSDVLAIHQFNNTIDVVSY